MVNTAFTLHALLFTTLAATSSALRGGANNKKTDIEVIRTENSRRHLLPSDAKLDCVLFKRLIEFEDETDQEDWCCEFSAEQQHDIVSGVQEMICIDGVTNEALEEKGAMSGESLLKTKNAFIEEFFDPSKEAKLVVTEDNTEVEVLPESDRRHARQRRRNLANSQAGTTLRTLVVRVIDASGDQIAADREQLKDDVFEDNVCLKTQYAACSHNQLTIEPASDFGEGTGIVDVNVDVDAYYNEATREGNSGALEQAALTKLKELYGTGNNADGYNGLTEEFDLVLFCQPPGSGSWLAYAYVNDWRSFYNNYWCQKVSAQMHEVGHNLNLAHSGVPGSNPARDQYEDSQGLMGFSFNGDDGPRMCFNPVKNYQLGWYDNQTKSADPLDLISAPQTFKFNGVEDYDFGNTDALVSLRLENGSGKDYYIGFNRASGINSGTVEAKNSVTVLTKESGSPTQYGQSRRLAILSTNGDTYKISNWADSIFDVFITLDEIIDGKDAMVTVSTSEPFPTESPTSNCNSLNGRFKLDLTTDGYGVESSWKITQDSTQEIVYEGEDGYPSNTNFVLPSEYSSYCLEEGECYTFTMIDAYGDGICCSYGNGGYEGYLNGEMKFSGTAFGKEQKHTFCVPVSESNIDEPSTSYPTVSPTAVPTTRTPTESPTISPTTPVPTSNPTMAPTTSSPSSSPSVVLSMAPTETPTNVPTKEPSSTPTPFPSSSPSVVLSMAPTETPTNVPTEEPSSSPTPFPSSSPSVVLSTAPTDYVIEFEDVSVEEAPSSSPSLYLISDQPSNAPTLSLSELPTISATQPPLPMCQDISSKIKFKNGRKTKNWKCKHFKQKKKCNKTEKNTKISVWSLCPVSCQKYIPSNELQNLPCTF